MNSIFAAVITFASIYLAIRFAAWVLGRMRLVVRHARRLTAPPVLLVPEPAPLGRDYSNAGDAELRITRGA